MVVATAEVAASNIVSSMTPAMITSDFVSASEADNSEDEGTETASSSACATAIEASAAVKPIAERCSGCWEGASLAIAIGTGLDVGRAAVVGATRVAGRGRRDPGPIAEDGGAVADADFGRGRPLSDRACFVGEGCLEPKTAEAGRCRRDAFDATECP